MSVYKKQLQALINEFFDQVGEAARTRDIARWAIENRKWKPEGDIVERRLADDLAAAMRAEHITDPQGRSVRAKHAARINRNGRSEIWWNDVRRAPRAYMEVPVMQRRDGIVGDCRQLKADVDSYNDNVSPKNPIQISFNFTNDLADLEAGDKAMKKGA